MIELSDIKFRWRPSLPLVLDIAQFDLAEGEKVFLQGPSGSGKTTLLNILGGIVTPQSGTVHILDQDIAALSGGARDQFRADHLGIIFQVFNLIPYLSVIENVLLPCRFSKRRMVNAINRGGAINAAARDLLRKLSIDANLDHKKAIELSTGQQQRVAVARALIGDPTLIIADEPTSALDQENTEAFLDLLLAEVAERNASLLFVSHDQGLSHRFDRSIDLAKLQRHQGEGA